MSAFNFINSASSPSPSLLDDLYESQEFHSFVNQGSWHSSAKSSPKVIERSNSSTTTSSRYSTSPQPKNSAFSFIKQASPSPILQPLTDLAFSSSSLSKSEFSKASPQVKLSSMNTHWSRLESDRSHDIQSLERLYKKRTNVHEQINQLVDSIQLAQQQKDTALADEDYAVAQRMHENQEKMNASLVDLKTNVSEQLGLKIQHCWQNLYGVIKKETDYADDMIEQLQIVKDEREHHLVKFGNDSERIYENKMQGLQSRREKVESDKSEVAFDFGMWEQSDSDLRERMDEAIQEETEKKIELSAHARNLQTEIEELLRKVDELTIEKKKALKDLDHVESVIKDTLQPFMGEKQEHDREYQAIQQRKEDTDHITVQLDEDEIALHKQIKLHQNEKARGWEELDSYDKKMKKAAKRKEEGWVELETIEKISKIIQSRDQKVIQQQSKITKSWVALLQQKEETSKLQKKMILGKQKQVEQTELINQIENKLSSMKRYKTLAVESGQFHNAKKLNGQIKMMEKELTNAKEENKNKTDDGTTYWQEAKSKLEKIKLEHEDLEYQLETEKKAILGKAKEELQLIYNNTKTTSDLLKSVLDYELIALD